LVRSVTSVPRQLDQLEKIGRDQDSHLSTADIHIKGDHDAEDRFGSMALKKVADERGGFLLGAVIECDCARRFAAFEAEADRRVST
jgi:hypothetical protein